MSKRRCMLLAATLVVAFLLSGCAEKTDLRSQFVGEWGTGKSDEVVLILYNDGTSESLGTAGKGEWEIIENRQFKITNSDGETEVADIESIDEEKMVLLLDDGNSVTLFRIGGSLIEDQDSAESNQGSKLKGDYQIKRFLTEIQSSGDFWVEAVSGNSESGSEESMYISFDKYGNEMCVLDANEYIVCSPIYDGLTMVKKEQEGAIIIDRDGNDVSYKYVDSGNEEKLLAIREDSTGITIWTIQDTDTYDSHVTTLRAKNTNGDIKQSWESGSVENSITQSSSSIIEDFHYVAEGIYAFDNYVINIKTGHAFYYPPSGNSYKIWGVDKDGFIYTVHNNGNNVSMIKYNDMGGTEWNGTIWGEFGEYSEGLIFLEGEDGKGTEYNGFINANGEYVLKLDLWIRNTPKFIGDYALIECANEMGTEFVTLVDKQGNIMFEPIRGKDGCEVSGQYETYAAKVAEETYYVVTVDDQVGILKPDGTVEDIPSYWLYASNQCQRSGDSMYWVIENGALNCYEFNVE